MGKNKSENKSNEPGQSPFSQTFFHGTKADLKIGDFIAVGLNSNYGQRKNAKYIYLTATKVLRQLRINKFYEIKFDNPDHELVPVEINSSYICEAKLYEMQVSKGKTNKNK